jgi:phosphoribosylformylglycinamidine synthase
MAIRIEVGYRSGIDDPRGKATLATLRSFLGLAATDVRSFDVYVIDAPLAPEQVQRVLGHFTDAVTQRSALDRLDPEPFDFVIAVGFRPGVTDAVGRSAQFALQDMLGHKLPDGAGVYTSRLYFVSGVTREQADSLATGLLANPLIERYSTLSHAQYLATEPDRSVPAIRSTHCATVEVVDLAGSDADLLRISRTRILSLTLEEMRVIRDQYAAADFAQARHKAGMGPQPTDVELECLAQTWSEHCKHKIFSANITYQEPGTEPSLVRSPFKEHIRDATEAIRAEQIRQRGSSWLVSVFHDNAGVIAFNDRWHLVYKVETHNSPSALDPYGGSMTGIVGVNRDPFGTGMGAELLSNVWGYCLADPRHDKVVPKGLMHPRRIRDGVHRGVIDGGNQSGIPYGRGWELFDERYLGKPLVYCGTVGKMPVQVAGRPAHEKEVRPGYRIVMCGGRIGKDGIHGATFSSAELDESSPVQAVQIGDPITQKRMFDFLLEARDQGLYAAMTDNGAGGLSSSVGELCQYSAGARLELSLAPLKYPGLDPWEILISEAQERMTLAVPQDKLQSFFALAARREVEATDLGEYTDTGVFEVTWQGKPVAWLPLAFLHDGLPKMELRASWNPPTHETAAPTELPPLQDVLVAMLRGPNLASGEKKARSYDHEVKALTVVKPYVGVRADMPADAAVFLVEHGSVQGYVLSEGINPFYSDLDTRWMTASVIDEAVRKAVGSGARLDHLAGLDNYCWPDPIPSDRNPDGEHKLAQLIRSTRALSEFCIAYGVPCISGKDSMKNDSMMGGVRISIPPTLLFSVIGKIDDVRKAVTLEAHTVGAHLYLLGLTRPELAGSELYRLLGVGSAGAVPTLDPSETLPLYRKVEEAIRLGILESCHAPCRGGVAVGLSKIAMGGELGLCVDLAADPWAAPLDAAAALFSESNGRFLVTVAAAQVPAFDKLMSGLACSRIGEVTSEARLRIRHAGIEQVNLDVLALKALWKETFDAL